MVRTILLFESESSCRPAAVLQKWNWKNEDILYVSKFAEVVDMALGRLQRAGIVLLEWHSLLHHSLHRMNVPVLIRVRICISRPVPMVIYLIEFFICRARQEARPCLSHSLFDGPSSFTPFVAPSEDRRRLSSQGALLSDHSYDLVFVHTAPGTLSTIIFHPRRLWTRRKAAPPPFVNQS